MAESEFDTVGENPGKGEMEVLGHSLSSVACVCRNL